MWPLLCKCVWLLVCLLWRIHVSRFDYKGGEQNVIVVLDGKDTLRANMHWGYQVLERLEQQLNRYKINDGVRVCLSVCVLDATPCICHSHTAKSSSKQFLTDFSFFLSLLSQIKFSFYSFMNGWWRLSDFFGCPHIHKERYKGNCPLSLSFCWNSL